MFLRSVENLNQSVRQREHPFNIPTIHSLQKLVFNQPVTFFVGENGSGKSTLLEGIADRCEFNLAGGGKSNVFSVHEDHSTLGTYLRLAWMPKTTNGFFLRAESFYQFASHIDEIAKEYPSIYDAYGGQSLHHQSHGESFFSLFNHRFRGGGIYLLDEPEAALSPQRQLALLKVMHDLVKEGCQFIIATHSPILLGYPEATIYHFDDQIVEIPYEDVSHVQLTKYFLTNRAHFLQQLFEED